ncbi:class I SAM-dependent methyltransferase [Algoriphagus sp. D3-2-R+10]|uniref:class I SAM-dependent methyltransferase n=1 Tax=Algoriphagus aurantiacus TaxID=3103948 RepID=UPI002B36A30B|nr:class I SAM-dependent methyltransferase [Algoriphagus sp. D3-2-R+10]MEB2776399.1 class I SAM-dependent methyltransferase [Algoriphagus sp. D3-2-R+10]
MKDNFSTQSDKYAKYRPTYPSDLFSYLNSIIQNKQSAWDCGTGNGQVAYELAKTFDNVYATDISQSQIDNALQADYISYSVQPAEKTNFDNSSFDLIVVAQAIHWFDFEHFYNEVRRTAKENALLCVVGYGKVEVSEQIDVLIGDFYENVIGEYWDKERKYIDENYKSIPFPFNEIQTPDFVNTQHWTLGHLIGYLNTWSAVKHFIRQNNYNPIDKLKAEIEQLWDNDQTKEVRFPILLRLGKIT